jgi:hypothetical protein
MVLQGAKWCERIRIGAHKTQRQGTNKARKTGVISSVISVKISEKRKGAYVEYAPGVELTVCDSQDLASHTVMSDGAATVRQTLGAGRIDGEHLRYRLFSAVNRVLVWRHE